MVEEGFLVRRATWTLRRAGWSALVREVWAYLRARWQLRNATRAGHARAWGRVLVENRGELVVGERVRIQGTMVPVRLACHEGGLLSIGDGTYLNYGVDISATTSVRIGRECAIGQYSIILDSDYHRPGSHWEQGETGPVVIEDGVWLGARVMVLRGSHIGTGAVIGANSVVRGFIPPGTLAAGAPARVIRSLEEASPP